MVTIPFADFAPLAQKEGSFDFVHLKDWTFVDPRPLNQPFVFSNMMLIGGPPGCCPTGQVCTTLATDPTSTNTAVTTTADIKSGTESVFQLSGWLMLLGFFF